MYSHVWLVHAIGQLCYTYLYTLSANVLLCVSEISSYTCTCINTVNRICIFHAFWTIHYMQLLYLVLDNLAVDIKISVQT